MSSAREEAAKPREPKAHARSGATEDSSLLEVTELTTTVRGAAGELAVVDGVSLALEAGEMVGLVGESGSGKTMTALSVLRLHPSPPARIAGGRIRFRGEDLLAADEQRMRALRGRELAIVFQEPLSALNPVLTVGEQVAEVLRAQRGASRRAARDGAVEALRSVDLPSPEARAAAYPHQLSGGMRQRVLIAMALAARPALLFADEPTTALDVTLQAQVLALLAQARRELGLAVLLISHDLGLVAHSCSRTIVLYAGQVVESGPTAELVAAPRHPYTAGLLATARALSLAAETAGSAAPLPEIGGSAPAASPSVRAWPPGCRFAERCARARQSCRAAPPALERGGGREVRCLYPLADGEEL